MAAKLHMFHQWFGVCHLAGSDFAQSAHLLVRIFKLLSVRICPSIYPQILWMHVCTKHKLFDSLSCTVHILALQQASFQNCGFGNTRSTRKQVCTKHTEQDWPRHASRTMLYVSSSSYKSNRIKRNRSVSCNLRKRGACKRSEYIDRKNYFVIFMHT